MSSRVATEQIREHFTSREADALQVQVPNIDPKARSGHASTDSPARCRSSPAWRGSTRPPATTTSNWGQTILPYTPPNALSQTIRSGAR